MRLAEVRVELDLLTRDQSVALDRQDCSLGGDLAGPRLAGVESLQRCGRAATADGDEGVVVDGRDPAISHLQERLSGTGAELRHAETVAAAQPRGADPLQFLIVGLVVRDAEGQVEVAGGRLEGNAVRSLGRERVLLVVLGVVAELAARRRAAPAVP